VQSPRAQPFSETRAPTSSASSLLPAVRANTSPRHLIVRAPDVTRNEFMRDAEALVAARNAAAAP
jgi:hypothetical protein